MPSRPSLQACRNTVSGDSFAINDAGPRAQTGQLLDDQRENGG
jgi:hypothetical protein